MIPFSGLCQTAVPDSVLTSLTNNNRIPFGQAVDTVLKMANLILRAESAQNQALKQTLGIFRGYLFTIVKTNRPIDAFKLLLHIVNGLIQLGNLRFQIATSRFNALVVA